MSRLILTTENGQTQPLELRPGITRLGRAEDNDYILDCPSISTHHCEIVTSLDSILVRDLDSTNGTFVGGQRVKESALAAGQVLQLGDVRMVIEATVPDVAVPTLEQPCLPESRIMEDGSLSCLNHAGEKAIWRCTHCALAYCNTCVHHMRRVGGRYMSLCPQCSFPCRLLEAEEGRKKRSVFKFLKRILTARARRHR